MIRGNTQARTLLQQYFSTVQSGTPGAQFLLLSGMQGVGKTTAVEKHIHELLGLYSAQDYLPLYDCSSVLGKKHTFKVEVADKEQIITGDDGTIYRNLGARNIGDRLALSPAGTHKILFIENIERMTISAANALLKSLEEPLPGRIIVATTTNYKKLLDTIISRALIVRFEPLSLDEVADHIKETHDTVAPTIASFVAAYSLGAPGRASTLIAGGYDLGAMSELYEGALRFYTLGGSTVTQYQRLQRRHKEFGSIEQLLDALLYSITPGDAGSEHLFETLIAGKKLLTTNVSTDTVLFWLSL